MLQNSRTSKCAYPRTPFWRAGPIPGRTTAWGHLRQRAFQTLACCVPPGPVLGRAGFVRRAELFVQTLKHGVGTVIGAQPQNPAPGVFDNAPGLEHDLLHHRLHAPPLGRMAQGCVFADECVLTNQAQDVYALISSSEGFFLGARVVHHKGVPAHGHVATRQGIKAHRAPGVLALHQQAQIGLQNFVVGDATDSYRKFAVNQRVDIKALGILPNQRQTGVGSEVVGEFFNNKMWCSPSGRIFYNT